MARATGETAMTDQYTPEPLWGDSKIAWVLGATTDAMVDYASSFNIGPDAALQTARAMRDQYEAERARLMAENAELKRQLAARAEWEPAAMPADEDYKATVAKALAEAILVYRLLGVDGALALFRRKVKSEASK